MSLYKLKTAMMSVALIALFACPESSSAQDTKATEASKEITGAGATFPYPIYAKWAEAYANKTGIKLNYQSIGSGGGIKQIEAGTVNFGASDKPLEVPDLQKNNLLQFPAIIGGVVPIINLEGMSTVLQLDGDTLGDIFSGAIQKWNDPKIVKLNPGAKLPDTAITVVHRSDGSGTTFIFSTYLFQVNSKWRDLQMKDAKDTKTVKPDTTAQWPANSVGGKGNEGVAGFVKQTPNSIGYVEFAYAKENQLSTINLINHDGKLVEPSLETFAAAAQNADWKSAPGFRLTLTDQKGAKSWPIAGASFILLKADDASKAKNKDVCSFFDDAFKNGKEMAQSLNYVPLPDSLVKMIEVTCNSNKLKM